MPSSKKTVEIIVKPPISEMRKSYRKKINAIKDLATVYSKAAIFLDRWVQSNFKTQGDKVGGWQKLKLGGRFRGKGRKRRFDVSAKVLQDTGRLRASFLPFANKKNAGVGSDLPYSESHNKGKGVPKRRILPVEPEVRKEVKKIFENHVKKALKK